jgi:hypothetical protein
MWHSVTTPIACGAREQSKPQSHAPVFSSLLFSPLIFFPSGLRTVPHVGQWQTSMISTRFHHPQRLIFAVLVLSGLCSKSLHIYQHRSLPVYLLALYFPTFFIEEVLLFGIVWLLLYTTSGLWSVAAVVISALLAFVYRFLFQSNYHVQSH